MLDTERERRQIFAMLVMLEMDDDLYRLANAEAAAQGIGLTELVERAIQEYIEKAASAQKQRLSLPVSTSTRGLFLEASNLQEAVTAANLVDDRRQVRRGT